MLNILLLDDEENSLDTMCLILRLQLDAKVTTTKYPEEARTLASRILFDLVIIDVTLDYKSNSFGGLEFYEELRLRYGSSSLLAYSSYIHKELLNKFSSGFNFIDKTESVSRWAETLCSRIRDLRSEQTAFVAMPFSSTNDLLFKKIRATLAKARYKCVRVDQQAFTQPIVTEILAQIASSKFFIFVTLERNPNVFFEAGYAVALGKEVIIITNNISELPFNIRDRNALVYEDLPSLGKILLKRLRQLTAPD